MSDISEIKFDSSVVYQNFRHHLNYSSVGKSVFNTKSGIGKSFVKDFNFYVSNIYPFELIKSDNNSISLFDLFSYTTPFNRRIDAERFILKNKIKFYKSKVKENIKVSSNFHKRKSMTAGFNGDNHFMKKCRIELEKLKIRLNNLEDEHPEWLI